MSSVKIVKARLVDFLQQALPDVQVIYGPASAVSGTTKKILTIGGFDDGFAELDSMEATTESERYSFDCQAAVSIAGNDQQKATEAVVDIYVATKIALREFPGGHDLGLGESVQMFPTGNFKLQERADQDGRHAQITFKIAILAQVT